ncbi:hypothetical protein LEP1GSC195_2204 [Leptospira wolbachii serovar Codice str. CDC]|uniref:Uncharacterized protein n=1 Tax=Leptospira wolbachii serovar Codice str. CDC TaxID=1218599 RepID=R9A2Q0_9LEPT|nr:hypothetical protein LEP1GSC195_2204 [Leptospira wolbachii serovar Codice str. CDC]
MGKIGAKSAVVWKKNPYTPNRFEAPLFLKMRTKQSEFEPT